MFSPNTVVFSLLVTSQIQPKKYVLITKKKKNAKKE